MRIVDCQQGSARWHHARSGRPTASRFADIVTSTGKAVTGAKREGYMLELLAERLTGRVTEHFVSAAMERGTRLEPVARSWYTMETGRKVLQVGFVYGLDGKAGGSPDGLVGDDSGLEVKCLGDKNHLDVLLSGKVPALYVPQVQGCMWVCERASWDFVAYTDSKLPSVIIPCERDEKVIAGLAEHVPAFIAELDAKEADLRAKYGIAPPDAVDLEQVSGDWCDIPDVPLADSEKPWLKGGE